MISLLCPTRGRVKAVKFLLRSFLNTQKNDNQIIFYVQNDDPEAGRYEKLFKDMDHNDYVIGDWFPTTCMWNILASRASGNIFGLAADDILIKTNHWDEIINQNASEYKDNVFLFGTNDGRSNNIGGYAHYFLHKDMYNFLGFFCPPWLNHRYIDALMPELFDEVGRAKILTDVLFSHRKYQYYGDETWGKSRLRWTSLFDQINYASPFSERWKKNQLVLLKKYMDSQYNKE